ncbi:hypothetical protein [Amycolatopsis minnesotensis]|uniref:Uncharacterized protein n=1 Tax=Amycolatopsis minnesotensis TaxID=337894 RepID=A0ABN2SIF0_9PSEU
MPEPILISISAALAAKAATGLYDLVKRKFAKDPEATAALTAATETPEAPEPIAALAQRLEIAEAADPSFAEELRAEWEKASVAQHAESGGVANQVTGNVTGKVLQARDIHGNVTF